jgi:hypothetical protein
LNEETVQALTGKTPQEVIDALVPEGWLVEPSRTGGGVRYRDGKGNQVRIMPGERTAHNPSHRGPYAVISLEGRKVRILLAGNPVLGSDE